MHTKEILIRCDGDTDAGKHKPLGRVPSKYLESGASSP